MTAIRRILPLLALAALGSCAKPLADFAWTGDDSHAPAEFRFENRSKHADRFAWDFGDGNASEEASPSHIYSLSGDYTVALTARRKGKEHRTERKLTVHAPVPCLVEILTPQGRMVAQLYDETPKHRDNFIHLVEQGYYDSLLFHRVIRGFMVQGGDPNSRGAARGARLGSGGPGYQVDAEITPSLVHHKGALCAARMSDGVNPQRRSSGSQFYIVQGNKATDGILDGVEARKGFRYTADQRETYKRLGGTPHLDQDYTVFGTVIEGLDVIDRIAAASTGVGDRPEEDIWMIIRVVK
jgi:cyclophilin family peptidyl-prolyl cis-trans isomerase